MKAAVTLVEALAVTAIASAMPAEHDSHRDTMPARASALVEGSGGPGLRVSERLAPHRRPAGGLPVPDLGSPTRHGPAYYTVTTVDARGRLADRSPLRALRWAPGRSIAIEMTPGMLIAAARPDGTVTVTRQGHLRLPADLRHSLRIGAGDRLLVAAYAADGLLVAYTMPTVETMVARFHAATGGTLV